MCHFINGRENRQLPNFNNECGCGCVCLCEWMCLYFSVIEVFSFYLARKKKVKPFLNQNDKKKFFVFHVDIRMDQKIDINSHSHHTHTHISDFKQKAQKYQPPKLEYKRLTHPTGF